MTGPAARGTERGTRAPSGLTGTQGAVGAILVVLALGLALRLFLAYLLPGSGFGVDIGAFRAWAANLAAEGLRGFYQRDFFHDYTPGYLYVLWVIGMIGSAIGGVGVFLIKIPAILADLAIGWLVWSMILELGGRRSLALAAAGIAVVNPISWFDSVVWGQVDSVGVVFLLLGLREIWRDHPERSAIYAVIAALIKPQLGILIPILALVTIRRAFWPVAEPDPETEDLPAEERFGDDDDQDRGGVLARLRHWERRTDHPIRIVTTGLVALVTTVLICLPFGLSVIEFSSTAPYVSSGLLNQIFATASGYPYVTVNAFNPWALVAGDTGYSLANAGLWICDGPWGADACGSGTAFFGSVPAVVVGTLLMLAVTLVASLVAARRPDRMTILLSLAILAIAFYVVPTRVHERYAYPAFALVIILAAFAWRWRVAYAVFSVTVFLNMYAALTNPFYKNPGISDWLGIGTAVRSEGGRRRHRPAQRRRLPVGLRAGPRGGPRPTGRRGRGGAVARPGRGRRRVRMERGGRDSPKPRRARRGRHDPLDLPDGVPAPARWPSPRRGRAARPRRAAAPAALAVASVTMPTWSPRATFDELGVVGWFRERLRETPIRPDRSTLLRQREGRTAGPARPVDRRRPRHRDDAAADVPAGRAVPDALRRGLPRPDRHRVPPEVALRDRPRDLRVHPPAPGQVRDGRRDRPVGRGRRGRLERARGPRPRLGRGGAPGRPARSAPARGRAAPRGHRDRDPHVRPGDARAHLEGGGTGGGRPRHRRDGEPARHRLRRRPDRDPGPRLDR